MDLVKSPADRVALEYLYATQEMGRPYAAPPGTPPERVAALRQAFDETMVDPDFLRDAARSNLDVTPITGAAVQEIIARLYQTPREIIDRVEALRGPLGAD
jgi:tripartite-type tricarboxylate transporter receptor subunit TctC